jgi:hypothetical protein
MHVKLKKHFKTITFYFMKLATEFYWKPSYLLGEKPSLFERYLANTQWEQQSVKMSEPVMLPSI